MVDYYTGFFINRSVSVSRETMQRLADALRQRRRDGLAGKSLTVLSLPRPNKSIIHRESEDANPHWRTRTGPSQRPASQRTHLAATTAQPPRRIREGAPACPGAFLPFLLAAIDRAAYSERKEDSGLSPGLEPFMDQPLIGPCDPRKWRQR